MTHRLTRPFTTTLSLSLLLLGTTSLYADQSGMGSISGDEIQDHVEYLASDELEGRGTGSEGERLAARYLAEAFSSYGLEPGTAEGTFFQAFQVSGGISLGDSAVHMTAAGFQRSLEARGDFAPFGFSSSGAVEAPLVFVGYGITDESRGYDDYAGIDVEGKIVVVLRFEPRAAGRGRDLSQHATFVSKANNARSHGAAAMLVVNDPINHPNDDSLLPVNGQADMGIKALMVRQSLIEGLFGLVDRDLGDLQREIDEALEPRSFALDASARLNVELTREVVTAHNVIAKLPGTDPTLADEVLVIGAHYDHLGYGHAGGSLGGRGAAGEIHNGADDNASGTSGILELAQAFAGQRPRRTIYFVAFSGEERGLLGSQHWVENPPLPLEHVTAMINLDMIGRLGGDALEVGGVDTADGFRALATQALADEGLEGRLDGSGYGPSDHASFYGAGVPVLFLFTGLHDDYHRPSDDADKLDHAGAARVARVAFRCAETLANQDTRPEYKETRRGGNRAVIGIRPSTEHQGGGVLVETVVPRGAAQAAGMEPGDVILSIDERSIDDLNVLVEVLGSHAPGDEIVVVVRRGEGEATLQITLGAR
jgi:Peptidase family M28/PDZ domain/PA domain